MKARLDQRVTLFGLLCLLAIGCGEESFTEGFDGPNSSSNTDATAIAEIQITPASLDMHGIGTTVELNLIVRMNDGSVLTDIRDSFVDPVNEDQHDVAWGSENAFVAQFDAPGRLRAVSAGETLVHAAVEDHVAEIPVTVTASLSLDPSDTENAIPLHVANIEIKPGDVTLVGPGDNISLSATLYYSDQLVQEGIRRYFVHPSGEVAGQIGWFSSDPAVATVSGYGIIHAQAPGDTTIIVYNPWNEIFPTDEMIVTVGETAL